MNTQGTVRGSSIVLERPLPELEGKKVRVQLEVLDDGERSLSADEQRAAWDAWVAHGPDGPPADDSDGWP